MKITKLLFGLFLILCSNSFAQTLKGGNKNFGDIYENTSQWYFTQTILNKPLNKSNYGNKIYYFTKKMEYDINNDDIKDAGDFALKNNNTLSNNSEDLLLLTIPELNNYKGTEVEIYTDCIECISLYRNGITKNIYEMNLFRRYSKVIPAIGKPVRTITSTPILAQIPNHINKREFTVEIGMKIRVAKKISCSKNEISDYQVFPVSENDPYGALNSPNSYFLSEDSTCRFRMKKSSDKIKTPLINWGNEYEFDKYIMVYTFEY